MHGIDLLLAKLDSALGNVGTDINAAQWKTPTGSPVKPEVRRQAREAARAGDKAGALRTLLVAAADAGAGVPAPLLDDAEAHLATLDPAPSDADRAAITTAVATLRSPVPAAAKKKGLLGFLRR